MSLRKLGAGCASSSRAPNHKTAFPRSEEELQPELHDSRVFCPAGQQLSKVGIINVHHRPIHIDTVESVKRFGPELYPHLFVNGKDSSYHQISIGIARAAYDAPPRRASSSERRSGEPLLVEVALVNLLISGKTIELPTDPWYHVGSIDAAVTRRKRVAFAGAGS